MKRRLCSTPGCFKTAKADRKRCATCDAHTNPLRYAYRHLKANAKRRGKHFDLTLDEFADFARRTEYLTRRGRTATSYHIDRIDPTQGYTAGNIQVLTNRENVLKQRTEGSWNPARRQMEFYTFVSAANPYADVPS
ncbi:hypothetical protein [Hymenobacter psychrotolerans]|uniref:Uncharacterized protein n=1 Tax=Hymenobacter psychrotolerans DSM 18569 TaxID=1121959 RepID=A0A1M7G6I6_9BACT|nr:hypothetical protein [Hymenobacter psychrotolerans]SHM12004.1 hypothetical protein SAMN02746009_03972 [Hymenobacter psychrotolerans DSM 18569]